MFCGIRKCISLNLEFLILFFILTCSVIESKLEVASSKIRIGEFLRMARAIA